MSKQKSELVLPESFEPPAAINDTMSLIQHALNHDVDVNSLERLFELHEKVEKRNAELAFNEAMRKFKADCPILDKPSTADTGKYKYKYASFGYVCQRIAPYLDRHGFSYSFDTELHENVIKAICRVKHVAGHCETSTFAAPIDTNARMNVTQQAASAVSYAKRYALLGAFGIATAGDDDAAAMDSRRIKPEEFVKLKVRWWRTIDKQATKDQDDREEAFTAWASETVGRDFEATNINNWTYSDFITCDNTIYDVEALKDGQTIEVGDAADDILNESPEEPGQDAQDSPTPPSAKDRTEAAGGLFQDLSPEDIAEIEAEVAKEQDNPF